MSDWGSDVCSSDLSVWAPSLRLGTASVPAFTRGPACMAQSVAPLADAAPGRFAFGIGTSSNVIVEGWNGIPFESPYQRTRDMVRFLRAALAGEKVTMQTDSFDVRSFKLGVRPGQPVPTLNRKRSVEGNRLSIR